MLITSLLKPEIKEWLQKSIHSELYASNLYKHLASQMQRQGFFGAQKYFEHESKEELEHYQILANYLNDMGDYAEIPSVEPFVGMVMSIGDALEMAYNAEKNLLYQYQDFYEEAEDEGDCITSQFIAQKFFPIQISSVGAYGDLITRYNKAPMDVFEYDEFLEEQIKD